MTPDSDIDRRTIVTIVLCSLAALMEGIDIVSLGLAMPKLGPEFDLASGERGYALSASLVGLAIGAVVGGRLADSIGRKKVLVASMAALGVFSLATTVARDFPVLLLVRLCVGFGLGGAFPMLIAISTEASPKRFRATALSLVYSALPIGGALLSLIVGVGGDELDWRVIFYIGGLGPLVLLPVWVTSLPESAQFQAAASASDGRPRASVGVFSALFGEGRGGATLLLWTSYVCTLFVVYLLINWIPSLMVAKGLTAAQGAMVSLALNLGSAAGSVTFGAATDRGFRRLTIIAAYVALVASLVPLAYLEGYVTMLVAATLVGFFMLGCQLILYAMAPEYYPTLMRGTGVGAAVAAGRVGSIAAPSMAGLLLGAGYGASAVLATSIPFVVVASLTALALLFRPGAAE